MFKHIPDCGTDREAKMTVIGQTADGKGIVWCDPCIEPLVRALNRAGFATVASCCGHGLRLGNIALADGRELLIAADYEEARAVEHTLKNEQ